MSNFVNVPLKKWMMVFLQDNWQSCVFAIRLKVYSLSNEIKKLVDNMFDKL